MNKYDKKFIKLIKDLAEVNGTISGMASHGLRYTVASNYQEAIIEELNELDFKKLTLDITINFLVRDNGSISIIDINNSKIDGLDNDDLYLAMQFCNIKLSPGSIMIPSIIEHEIRTENGMIKIPEPISNQVMMTYIMNIDEIIPTKQYNIQND